MASLLRSKTVLVLRGLTFFLLWIGLPASTDAQAPVPAAVSAALRSAGIPAASVALYVQPLGAAKPVLAHNLAQSMNPASTIKLLTTYAALELLGPTYAWRTMFYANGAQAGDVLEGDLVLRGTGDPKLTLENFWLMLRSLRARGVREIRGGLVLDRSYFDASDYDSSRFDNEPTRPYNVGPDALLVNFKAIRFHFVPDTERKSVHVIAEPRPPQLELGSTLQLTGDACGDWRARMKAEFQSNEASARAFFSGIYPAACGENTWNVAMLSHSEYVWGVFSQLWQELGGTLKGGVRDGRAGPGSRLLYTGLSPALSEIVRDINKFSNNVMARQLFLTLSAETMKAPGTAERSARVVRSWLGEKELEFPELVLDNGSGLSRIERIGAGNLGRLLVNAWQSAVMPEFIASMPLVAYDGTMRRRLKHESIAGQAHIKTGSLAGVRSMAGYVRDREGRRYAVVFFINHPNAAAGQPAMDAFLRWVYEGQAER